jgi:hypothetical protein
MLAMLARWHHILYLEAGYDGYVGRLDVMANFAA